MRLRSHDKSTSAARYRERYEQRALLLAALLLSAIFAPAALALKGAHVERGRKGTHASSFAHASIIGGTPAPDGAFPSLAYVLDVQGRYVYQCTGTVVAPSLILTAGHCAENMRTGVVNKPAGYRVVTGTVDPTLPEPHVSTVLAVIVYPGMRRHVDDGDAALLVLSAPTTAPPIALAAPSDTRLLQAGSPAVMAGWGLTSLQQKVLTERLRSAPTVVQGSKWCKANAPPFYAKSEICTITAPRYVTGACSGDSGGPLLVQRPTGEIVQVGIAVHVYGSCSTRRPSVFAGVNAISSWVDTWAAAYKLPPSPPASPSPPSPSPPLPVPTSPVPTSPVS